VGEFLKIAAGAFFGVIVGLLIQWWKSSRDELRLLCDEFCATVRQTADLSSEYWLSTGGAELAEARLTGMQRQLGGYRVLVSPRFHERQRQLLDGAAVDFFDAVSGGDFKVAGRPASKERAVLVQDKGAAFVLAIRTGFSSSMGLIATVRHHVQRWARPLKKAADWPRATPSSQSKSPPPAHDP